MGKYGSNFSNYSNSGRRYNDCPCDYERPCPPHPPYPPYTYTSCYLEAVGNTQDIAVSGHVVFDTDPDYLDIAGFGIELDSTGTVFTITRPGLYQVEWSINIGNAEPPVLIGLLENGEPASALSNNNLTGNHSSGALINVGKSDLPLTLSLHNFGGGLSLENPDELANTSASIRILRFANGPDVVY